MNRVTEREDISIAYGQVEQMVTCSMQGIDIGTEF